MRLVLMGTGPFAVPTFEAIFQSSSAAICQVVTRPSAEAPGSKKNLPPNPVHQWADSRELSIATPQSINEDQTIEWLSRFEAELLVVCDYGQILSPAALRTARLGGINLHGSLLPRHRGAAPVQWAILRGDQQTGISVIWMTPKLDGGPVLAQATCDIQSFEDAGQLEHRLSQLGVQPTLDAIEQLRNSESFEAIAESFVSQDPNQVTTARRLRKADGLLNCSYPAQLIARQICGLQPWPGVHGILNLDNQKSLRVNIASVAAVEVSSNPNPTCGTIDFAPHSTTTTEPTLRIACRDGFVFVRQIQPSGKRWMTAHEFMAGYGRYEKLQFQSPEASQIPHPLLEKLT